MPRQTLFISDLHLSAVRPKSVARFLEFLAHRAPTVERLYILGDLFDAYIGDDDESSPNREVKDALRRLSGSGTAVYFQHGNRDFLVGSDFCARTGAFLLNDYALIDLYGRPALLTHGDLLCTDDVQYQTARRRVRSAGWKRQALAKPLWMRQLYARWYRIKSGWDKGGKTAEIMDANADAVAAALERFGVDLLIHGHTHRPAFHDLLVNGTPARRIVLAEWTDTGGQVLCCRSDGSLAAQWLD
jgi:UDP-2,3-diacylglucosamine hydrolase